MIIAGINRAHEWHRRALSLVELAVFIAVLGLVSASAQRRQPVDDTQLIRYRSAITELSEAIRAMRWQAPAMRCVIEMRIDAPHGSFQFVLIDRAARIEVQRETIWLPDGLQIIDAPPIILATPTGTLSIAAIVIEAPALNRVFRLTTTSTGSVHVYEESAS